LSSKIARTRFGGFLLAAINIYKGASMKKLALAFLFCWTSTLANAQLFESKTTIQCGETKYILTNLFGGEVEEQPLWVGTNDTSKTSTVVMVNNNTQTWTVVQFDKKIACVLGVGEGFKFKKE
jgi:hypothetical protein